MWHAARLCLCLAWNDRDRAEISAPAAVAESYRHRGGNLAYARHHRNVVLEKTSLLFANIHQPTQRLRDELAQMDLSKDSRASSTADAVPAEQGEDFYISMTRSARRCNFAREGCRREADAGRRGEDRDFAAGKTWSFLPLKGVRRRQRRRYDRRSRSGSTR
jgi:hypothetical protein